MPRSNVRRDRPLVFLAVFLLFAPAGFIFDMVTQSRHGFPIGLLWGVFGGATSAAWAYTFITRRWWLMAPTILGSLVIPQLLPRLPEWLPGIALGADWPTSGRLAILAVLSLLSLTAGYIAMVTNLRATERESARAVAELELAGEVHRTLVPPIAASTPFAEVYGRSQASSSMGGDLIDLIVCGTHADIILGDVSGHGVNAGIVMAMLKSSLRTALLGGADLSAAVTDANRVLADLTAANMFATLAGVRVRAGGAMEYTLAGHLPVFHRKAAGGEWVEYDNDRLPLGIDGGETYPKVSVPFARGDVLVLLTDGLTEVQNAGGTELGLDGVRSILREQRSDGDLAALHDAIIARVRAYGTAGDDQSLILIRMNELTGI